MIIEITEEEREFLEHICIRAELFASMNLFRDGNTGFFNRDVESIKKLSEKFNGKKTAAENRPKENSKRFRFDNANDAETSRN
jgi:hypothetical protein